MKLTSCSLAARKLCRLLPVSIPVVAARRLLTLSGSTDTLSGASRFGNVGSFSLPH